MKVTQGVDVYAFAYDGMNRRVSEIKNGTLIKRFVWDGLTLAEERDAGNAVLKRFLPQGEVQGTTALFYARDQLGSVREVTDATGAVVSSYTYDAWGKQTLLAGTDLASAGYTGHYTHTDTNLVMAPFRAYEPETGRWLSRDPIGENGGINLYGYVSNNPINMVDPLCWLLDIPEALQSDFNAADAYLVGTPAGAILQELKTNKNYTVNVRFEPSIEDSYDPDSNTIFWNPRAALVTTTGSVLSPALMLGHEADHAKAHQENATAFMARWGVQYNLKSKNAAYHNAEEFRVIAGSEKNTATIKKEGSRSDHGGYYKQVNCPISR